MSKIYKVDFQTLEAKAGVSGKHLNSFEREVYNKLAVDTWDKDVEMMDAKEKLKEILSKSELEAFILYANSKNQSKVARQMKKSRSTIATYLERAYKKIKRAGVSEFF
jgi:DNA-binding CsgD family transcriptional regulator